MRKLLLIGLLSTAIVAGCSKNNDPDPDDTTGTGTTTGGVEKKPTPCLKTFETKPEYVKNAIIGFTNCSKDASTYLWDFGDGSATSTEKEPTHSYKANGSYTVKLYAYSANKTKVDSASMVVKIGDKFITKIVLTKFSNKMPDNLPPGMANQPWDSDGTPPDWAFTCSPGKQYDFNSARKRTTITKVDAAAAPVEWITGYIGQDPNRVEDINWQITDETWTYYLTEVDGNTYSFVPGLVFADKNLFQERFNPIVLENNDYKIELHWAIK